MKNNIINEVQPVSGSFIVGTEKKTSVKEFAEEIAVFWAIYKKEEYIQPKTEYNGKPINIMSQRYIRTKSSLGNDLTIRALSNRKSLTDRFLVEGGWLKKIDDIIEFNLYLHLRSRRGN